MERVAHISATSLFVFILISQSISARLMLRNQGSSMKTQDDDDMGNLMGLEECNQSDEDCLKRRMIAEAHLDYIYTQHHKAKGGNSP